MVEYASPEERTANYRAARLLSRPGVIMARAGTKHSRGVDTGRPCVTVAVARKKPASELTADELLPTRVDGIVTDVIETPVIRAHGPMDRIRPVIGGLSAHVDTGPFAGTLGGVVVDVSTNRLVALTNNHCAGLLYDPAYATPDSGRLAIVGLDMLQPSPGDGGTAPADRVGSVVRGHPMRFGTTQGTPVNVIDAAVCSIDEIGDAWFSILDAHAGPFLFGTAQAGMTVAKSGRTTGMTQGVVESANVAVNISYGAGDRNTAMFQDQIYYTGSVVSLPGDSGSLVLAIIDGQIRVVGLHFAGDDAGTMAFANHIHTVSNLLEISAWDGSVVIPRDLTPSVSVNNTLYLRSGDTNRPISHVVT